MAKKKKTMSIGVIIIAILFLVYGVPAAEIEIAKALQGAMDGFWYYFSGFLIFIIKVLLAIALIDGIMRQFNYSFVEFVEDIIKYVRERLSE